MTRIHICIYLTSLSTCVRNFPLESSALMFHRNTINLATVQLAHMWPHYYSLLWQWFLHNYLHWKLKFLRAVTLFLDEPPFTFSKKLIFQTISQKYSKTITAPGIDLEMISGGQLWWEWYLQEGVSVLPFKGREAQWWSWLVRSVKVHLFSIPCSVRSEFQLLKSWEYLRYGYQHHYKSVSVSMPTTLLRQEPVLKHLPVCQSTISVQGLCAV